MANEISLNLTLTFAKANIGPITLASTPQLVSVTGTQYIQNVQSIPTTGITALVSDSSFTPGYCVLYNTDLLNYVSIYANSSDSAALQINAGEWAMFRWAPTATPGAQANTAAVLLQYFIISA